MRLLSGAGAACLAVATLVAGCAQLPDIHVLRATAGTQPAATVVGSRGELPPARAEAVLNRLQDTGDDNLLAHHLEFVRSLGGAPLSIGNATRLLIDGPAAHTAMFEAIAGARDHVNLQTYIFSSDETGQKLADLLVRKQSEGVQVNVLYDSIGSIDTDAALFERLREAGVSVCEFNPVNPLKGRTGSLNHRDHRKMLVVDAARAYTGGINISAVYSSSSTSRRQKPIVEDGWRDTQIEIAGPAVAEFQKLFLETWRTQRCVPPPERAYHRAPGKAGNQTVRVIGSTPSDTVNMIYAEMLSAIVHARRSVRITMAYFVPDPQMTDALKDAAARGVRVELILPGVSDFWVVFHAGRSYYSDLLAAGVIIHERKDALLHAKTAVVDGVWATVGSANMDWRSFLHNDEVNAVVLGSAFGREMERMFEADLREATRVDPGEWAARGLWLRVRETTARLWEYWL